MLLARRRALLVLLLGVVTACGGGTSVAPERGGDLPAVVRAFVDAQHGAHEGYSVPSAAARRDLASAVLDTAAGRPDDASAALRRQRYRVTAGPDGTALLLPDRIPDRRGWGMAVVRGGGTRLVVESPHPRTDLGSDRLAAQLAVAARARYLVVAGARRTLDGGRADPAHEEDSVLQAVHVALAADGTPAVQVHGFADESLPSADVVVSSGAASVAALPVAVADRLEALGLRVCRAWREPCGELEGRTNVQGQASDRAGVAFVHLEVNRTVREDAERAGRVADAVARAVADSAG